MSIVFGCIFVVFASLIAFFTYKAPRLSSLFFWSLVTTILLTTAMLSLLPGPVRDRLFWMGLSMPIVWVAIQFWCYWDARPHRVSIGLMLICALSGARLWFGDAVI